MSFIQIACARRAVATCGNVSQDQACRPRNVDTAAWQPTARQWMLLASWLIWSTMTGPVTGQVADNRTQPSSLDAQVSAAWANDPAVARCGLCHFSAGNAFSQRATDFCQLTEARQYIETDVHAISRLLVEPQAPADEMPEPTQASSRPVASSNQLSWQICQNLGIEVDTDRGYQQFRERCLNCHAGDAAHATPNALPHAADALPGLACNYCHQVQDRSGWIDQHSSLSVPSRWRMLSAAEKAAAGMRDLIDAAPQAKLCGACHVGNQAQGMWVTHAMYVAGHPPLPAFELETYRAALPPHWREFEETYARLADFPDRDQYFAQLVPAVAALEPSQSPRDLFWRTRGLLVGALATAELNTALLADAQDTWGDYALYDCAGCHHSLETPSLRQELATQEIPGRPRTARWPEPLLLVALSQVDSAEKVEAARGDLRRAVNQTPFGLAITCRPLAKALRDALQAAQLELAQRPIAAEQAQHVLRNLIHTPESLLLDAEAARQVVWAMQVVADELTQRGYPLEAELRQSIDRLGGAFGQPGLSLPAPRSVWSGSGRQADRRPAASPPAVDASPPAVLSADARPYDPRGLISQLAKLRVLVP